MKFLAIMKDAQNMREFQNIILTLHKLAKECAMKIYADKIEFIANEESCASAPLVWVEIDAKAYFSEYNMEGLNERHPYIVISMLTANLAQAFDAIRHNAKQCKMKLAQIQFPCLTIETEAVLQGSDKLRGVTHDVPVTVIPRSDWSYYEVPEKPKSQIVLTMPINRRLRGIIEKVKKLSPSIIFYATSKGEISLVTETEMVTITTRFKTLLVRAINVNPPSTTKDAIEAYCSVDSKKISLFMGALQVPNADLSCGVDHKNSIHLQIDIRNGIAIHTILPAVSM